ncbi:hypothetical protein HDU86_003998 [Geranomyces michiganensis]|nr:hypothetical protein HDU86_003998 [Geranomyces michiganensis]
MAPFGLDLFTSRVATRDKSRFNLTEIGQLGTLGRATAVAYDGAQSLLAVGAKDGRVLLVGREWEAYIALSSNAITDLTFKVGDKFLVAAHEKGELAVWNLQKSCLQFAPVVLQSAITSLEAPLGTSAIYVGLSVGSVVFVDSNTGQTSDYAIPFPDGAPDGDRAVVALHSSPEDPNLLLIAYKSGTIVLWDLAERLVRRHAATAAGEQLRSACWAQEGRFVGATSSSIYVWEIKDGWLDSLKKGSSLKATRTFAHSFPDCTALRCVQRPSSSSADGKRELCLLLGGSAGAGVHPLEIKAKTASQWTPIFDGGVGALTVMDGEYLVFLTSEGGVKAVGIWSPESVFRISPSLELGSSTAITAMSGASASEYLGWEMKNISSHGGASLALPLLGGTVINKNGKSTWDVLATLHEDQTISFYQLSIPPRFVCKIPLFAKSIETTPMFSLDLEHRSLWVTVGAATRGYKWQSASEAKAYKSSFEEPDVDGLMAKMDAAVDAILQHTEAFKATPDPVDLDKDACAGKGLPPPLPPRESSAEDGGPRAQIADDLVPFKEMAGIPCPSLSPQEDSSDPDKAPAALELDTSPSAALLKDDEVAASSPSSQRDWDTPPPPLLPQRPSARRRDRGWVETDFEPETTDAGGWQPMMQVTHPESIYMICGAPWLDLLVTVTGGNRLNRLNLVRGSSIYQCDVFEEPISLISVVDTYYRKEATARTCILIGTGSGEINVCALDNDPTTGDTPVLRSVIYTPPHSQKPIFVQIMDDAGRLVRQAAARGKTGAPASDHYVLIVLDKSVCVIVLEPGKEPEVLASWSSPDPLVNAGICWVGGEAVMVVITFNGTIKAIKLPSLQPIWSENLPMAKAGELFEQGLRSAFIAKDGRIVIWTGGTQFRTFNIVDDTSGLPDVDIRMYELTRAMEWARANNVRPPSTALRSDRDKLLMPATAQASPRGASAHSSQSNPGSSGSQYGQTVQALNERGEKLQALENKFSDMADASGSFLSKIQEYNERQAKKKWYQL